MVSGSRIINAGGGSESRNIPPLFVYTELFALIGQYRSLRFLTDRKPVCGRGYKSGGEVDIELSLLPYSHLMFSFNSKIVSWFVRSQDLGGQSMSS